jgi:c(7)-type cytochrome triheme protein
MRRNWTWVLPAAALLGCLFVGRARAEEDKAAPAKVEKSTAAAEAPAAATKEELEKAPEFLKFEKVGKQAPVVFQHQKHAKRFGCEACHGGEKPLFEQKRREDGLKMADLYDGKLCGSCHNGKDHGPFKKVFPAMGACSKCHKQPEKQADKQPEKQ